MNKDKALTQLGYKQVEALYALVTRTLDNCTITEDPDNKDYVDNLQGAGRHLSQALQNWNERDYSDIHLQAYKGLERIANCSLREEQKKLTEKLAHDHCTLTQLYMGIFLQFCKVMADSRGDLRNEASIKLAKKIVALPEAEYLPFI